DRAQLASEVAAVREAHLLLVRQIEAIEGSLEKLGHGGGQDSERRSEALAGEVRMLEGLVHRMSETLDERLAQLQTRAAPAPSSIPVLQHERQRRQTSALLEEVREALAANRVDLYLQPVVSLPQRRTVFYESFSRLRDESGR